MSMKMRAMVFDVIFLSLIGIIGEVINARAVQTYFSGFYFSLTAIVIFLALYRLGAFGLLTAMAISITFLVVNPDTTFQTALVFLLGNFGFLLALFFLVLVERGRIKDHALWAMLYVVCGYLGMFIVRSIVAFLIEPHISWISHLFLHLSNEFLSLIAVAMIMGLLTKQKKLFVDLRSLYEAPSNL